MKDYYSLFWFKWLTVLLITSGGFGLIFLVLLYRLTRALIKIATLLSKPITLREKK